MGRGVTPQHLIDRAKELYISGETVASISAKVGICTATIERRARAEGWAALRHQGPKILLNEQTEKLSAADASKIRDIRIHRLRRHLEAIDDGEILLKMIAALQVHLNSKDGRVVALCCTSLLKCLEHRAKILPISAKEIVNLMLANGIKPEKLVRELRSVDWGDDDISEEQAG